MKSLTTREARVKIGEFVTRAAYKGESFTIMRKGRPLAVLKPIPILPCEEKRKIKAITLANVRWNFSEIISRVGYAKERFIILRCGKPLALIEPLPDNTQCTPCP